MIKQLPRTKKDPFPKRIELQYLHFENRKAENKKGLGLDEKEYESHSELINLLYDMNHWHYGHDFKTDIERIEQMVDWFGHFNFKQKLEGNRESRVWTLEINDTVYYMFLTPFGLFVETQIGNDVGKAYEDMKELSEVLLQNWKKKKQSKK